MERLEVSQLSKHYVTPRGSHSNVRAVDDVDLVVEPGEMLTLLGPSGCGKTTTLRCIAGLVRPDAGRISVGERVLFSSDAGVWVAANQRGIGMVFQSYAIWPHMNVFKNVSYPLEVLPRKSRPTKAKIEERVLEALEIVQLGHLVTRSATALSGGQQQRLALARALVMEPPLLLLDEPLSNLDARLRESMRFGLKELQRRVGVTAVYVTHDQTEALTMSHRIAVMKDGRVEQYGTPRDIYQRPASPFVAEFIGSSNLIEGTITHFEVAPDGVPRATITTKAGILSGIDAEGFDSSCLAREVTIGIRPESVMLEDAAPNAGSFERPNSWAAVVSARAFAGDSIEYILDVNGLSLRAKCPAAASSPPGSKVTLRIDAQHVRVLGEK